MVYQGILFTSPPTAYQTSDNPDPPTGWGFYVHGAGCEQSGSYPTYEAAQLEMVRLQAHEHDHPDPDNDPITDWCVAFGPCWGNW